MGQLTSILQLKSAAQHKTTVGIEQLFQRLDSERLSTQGQRYRLAAFGQHAWRVYKQADTRFDVVPGLRLDVDSQFGSQLSPKVALQFEPDDTLILRASYGRGFRAPSFQELLLRFENPTVGYVVVGNPNLGAETSHGFDAGATWAAREWLDLGATFFRNDLRNMIAIVSDEMLDDGSRYTYDNVTTAWTMGVESFAAVRAGEELSLRAGYTWLATHDGENDRELEGRPAHRITALLNVAPAGWDLDFNARFAVSLGRVFFEADDTGVEHEVVADPLTLLDLRLSKHITRHLELAVGVDNLFDAGDRFTVLRPRTVYGSIGGKY
jgi:outer membrane receptor for ferrienterochelin and colicins